MGEMSFDQAILRAESEHVKVDSFRQPGEGYRLEHRCRCGAYVFEIDWKRHIIAQADKLIMADFNAG